MIICRKKQIVDADIDFLLKKMQLEKEKVNRLLDEVLRITGILHTGNKGKNCTIH